MSYLPSNASDIFLNLISVHKFWFSSLFSSNTPITPETLHMLCMPGITQEVKIAPSLPPGVRSNVTLITMAFLVYPIQKSLPKLSTLPYQTLFPSCLLCFYPQKIASHGICHIIHLFVFYFPFPNSTSFCILLQSQCNSCL